MTTPERDAVISGRALTKRYRMGDVDVMALRGVDIELRDGELMVLLGASGSGKSTLLNILGGLDVCTTGRVAYRDEDLTTADEEQLTRYRRRHVGFVFQFYNLIPSLTSRENVALVTEIADDPMDAAEALALVGLAERLDHFPTQLSGGEQQRVAVARAIAKRPDILLCDEPTGALDFETGVRVHALELPELRRARQGIRCYSRATRTKVWRDATSRAWVVTFQRNSKRASASPSRVCGGSA